MEEKQTFDFSGWATRNDVKCSDGRIIRSGAFKHNDGQTVPLVWNHNHSEPTNVLGHALLQNRKEGVYAYCSFNNTLEGQNAKELVRHGDINSLSIYANHLKQQGCDVMHGTIREVSLVLAGSNPGALIENVMVHSEDDSADAIIFNASENLVIDAEFEHSDESSDEKTVQEVFDTLTEEQKTAVYLLIGQAVKDAKEGKTESEDVEHSDESSDDKTIQEVFDTLTEEQKTVVYALVALATENAKKGDTQEEIKEMKQNAFDTTENGQENVIAHSDIIATIESAKQTGSLREEFKKLCLAHSIDNIDVLFPDAKAISKQPAVINQDTAWVDYVMGKVHHTPFSRVKMLAFDITGENARARGYIKGQKKEEEVLSALSRETSPQTVYKVQKMDRDDIVDITDIDVIAWLKQEMRGKLNEELARAFLIGDGRSASSKDKIQPAHIRPILGDDSTYVISKTLTRGNKSDTQFAKGFIASAIKARKEYKGSGNPTLFCTEDLLTDMLLIEDRNERFIYDTMDKLKTTLRVRDIITVPVFDGHVREVSGEQRKLMGIFVNLNDYTVGADKGGAVTMFDDFDINYNKYEYLIETRCSAAMTQPYGAITFEEVLPQETPAPQEETPATPGE